MRNALALALVSLIASPSIAGAQRDDDRHSRPAPSRGNGNGNGHESHGNGRGRGHDEAGPGHGRREPAPPAAYAPGRGGGWYSPPPPARSAAPAPAPYPSYSAPSRTYAAPTYRTYAATTPNRVYVGAPNQPYSPAPRVYAPLWWWGLGWGWGYYPLFMRTPVEQASMPNGNPERVATSLGGTVAATPNGVASGISFAIEGRTTGVEASMDAISIQDVATGDVSLGSSSAIGLGTVHVTWAILSQDAFRLRFEAGASMISMPDSGTSTERPWSGKVAFGPDVGVSGHLGLVGPIGIEGHARITPVPFPATDTRAALALRGGPLAFTAGWRAINVMGDGVDAPSVRFTGPEVGLALMF